jgi:hypothetical protein
VQQPPHRTLQSPENMVVAGRWLLSSFVHGVLRASGTAGNALSAPLADASSATAGSHVTNSCFLAGALPELSVALVKGSEGVCWGALHMYATAGSIVARAGAVVPAVDSA